MSRAGGVVASRGEGGDTGWLPEEGTIPQRGGRWEAAAAAARHGPMSPAWSRIRISM